VSSVVDPAREGEVIECAAPTLKPSKDARARRLKKLKLNGSACLSLDDGGLGADPPATDEIADPDSGTRLASWRAVAAVRLVTASIMRPRFANAQARPATIRPAPMKPMRRPMPSWATKSRPFSRELGRLMPPDRRRSRW
jgi:hypothetical protein